MPALIHPIRLVTVAEAHCRLAGVCGHLSALLASATGCQVTVPEYPGLEGGKDMCRVRVQNLLGHAKIITEALAWAKTQPDMADAIVIECHGAESSGGSDLTLLLAHQAWLFEASAGTGNNVRDKCDDDLELLRKVKKDLLDGKYINNIKTYLVVAAQALGRIRAEVKNGQVCDFGEASIISVD